jgi:molybdopterin-binding protein
VWPVSDGYRISEAARILGVRPESLRRWEAAGRLRVERTAGGHRRVPVDEVARLLDERRGTTASSPVSARNRFPGVVTRVERDGLVALVEIMAGPHRVVALLTAEAVEDLGLRPGMAAAGVVKATNVLVEVVR